MSQLTVRCLGGFEVRLGESPITAFESNKVRALFIYLMMQRDRVFSREHLAALLWSEKSDEAGRRNLRQAVYNLKSAITSEPDGAPIILARGSELGIDPGIDCWLDVDAFVEARRQGITSKSVVPHHLTGAMALYRGDFLAGFNLKDSPEYESWQLAQQTRLRDQAIDALRNLVESYLTRGEFRLGIQYARRLVAIDSLSERAHRYLMRLYAASGARNRALLEYEQLRATLNRELDVEPLEETRQLYENILAEQTPQPAEEEGLGIGPLIPLVGRRAPYQQLRQCWQSVLSGQCQLSLVEGEAGIGKTRLVKSFLDAASSQTDTTIVKGQCSEGRPGPFQPFAEVLRNAVAQDTQGAQDAFDTAPEMLANLAQLVPELRQLLPKRAPEVTGVERDGLFESFAQFFDRICRHRASTCEPLVLLLGRLQWASHETLELIEFLVERLSDRPIWILATCSSLDDEAPPVLQLADRVTNGSVQWIHLERFGRGPVEEIASALLDEHQADELGSFLVRHGEGLPIVIAEWINSLWDGRVLTHEAGRWQLRESLGELSGDLGQLVKKRLRRLPSSIRRLAAQAAIMGEQFEARWLKEAADEHPQVVEIGLELLLERWLIRQHSNFWMTGRREHDIVLWAKGARLGSFEFNHRLIWQAIVDDVTPRRRQIMHRRAAETLEAHLGQDFDRSCETLAFHFLKAHEWERAIGPLRHATRKAHQLSDFGTALFYGRQAIEAADRLRQAAREPDEEQRWLRERTQLVTMLGPTL